LLDSGVLCCNPAQGYKPQIPPDLVVNFQPIDIV
jgi:hypothetical protein